MPALCIPGLLGQCQASPPLREGTANTLVAFPLSFVNPLRPEQHHYKKTDRQFKLGGLLKWVLAAPQLLLRAQDECGWHEGSERPGCTCVWGRNSGWGPHILCQSHAKSLMSFSVAVSAATRRLRITLLTGLTTSLTTPSPPRMPTGTLTRLTRTLPQEQKFEFGPSMTMRGRNTMS